MDTLFPTRLVKWSVYFIVVDVTGVPPYAVNRSFSEKSTPSPSRVPRPRLCVGVRIRLTFEDTPTPSRGRGTHRRQKGLTA